MGHRSATLRKLQLSLALRTAFSNITELTLEIRYKASCTLWPKQPRVQAHGDGMLTLHLAAGSSHEFVFWLGATPAVQVHECLTAVVKLCRCMRRSC